MTNDYHTNLSNNLWGYYCNSISFCANGAILLMDAKEFLEEATGISVDINTSIGTKNPILVLFNKILVLFDNQ